MSDPAFNGDIPLVVQRALRLIAAHPSVGQVEASSVPGISATLANIRIRTELPNAWKIEGRSPSGVMSVEPVQFLFRQPRAGLFPKSPKHLHLQF